MHRPEVAGDASGGFWALGDRAVGRRNALGRRPRRAEDAIEDGPRARSTSPLPLLFGAFLFFLWEVIVVGFGVPGALMPPPSAIYARNPRLGGPALGRLPSRRSSKGVLIGYAVGCLSGFAVAIPWPNRVPFLRRGLLPVGNFVAALPIIASRRSW